jgi:two-component system response regulator FixJ
MTSFKICVVDRDSRRRAALVRDMSRFGYAEPFEDPGELLQFWPAPSSVVLVHVTAGETLLASTVELMISEKGWLPLVAYGEEPSPNGIVDALHAGAIDFWEYPLAMDLIEQRIDLIRDHAHEGISRRNTRDQARLRMARLSPRERQVIHEVSLGRSNKDIANVLSISPRTVEIHRSNVMTKVEAKSTAELVRIAIEAELQ